MRLTGVLRARGMSLATEVLVLTCSVATAFQDGGTPQGSVQTALAVNGHEVSREEFRWYMEQERGAVFRYFQARHHLEDGQGFWTQEAGGTTPKAMLQTNTVARIVREKVEQIVFQELGLVQDTSYAAFLAQLDKVNQEREAAVRQGRVVYGPVRYTPLQFYEHRKATLRTQAKEKLGATRWSPREEDLRSFYKQNQARFRAAPSYALEVVTIQTKEASATGDSTDALQSAAKRLLSKLRAGSTLTNLLKEPPGGAAVKLSGQRFEEINADRLGEMFPDEQQLKAVLALGPGEATLLNDSNAQAKVVRCLGKTPETYRPYEAVQPQVRERWLAQQYDRHIERLASQAKVRVNQKAIDALFQ